jgi:hypothetical protein
MGGIHSGVGRHDPMLRAYNRRHNDAAEPAVEVSGDEFGLISACGALVAVRGTHDGSPFLSFPTDSKGRSRVAKQHNWG